MNNIERAIVYLADRCDGAKELDGQGFNSMDTGWGHSTADAIRDGMVMPEEELRSAMIRLVKYRGQLTAGGIDLDVDNPLKGEDIAEDVVATLCQEPIAPNQNPADFQCVPPVSPGPAEPVYTPPPHTIPLPPPPEIIPTEEQQEAVDLILDWARSGKRGIYKLGGYAGTGKTTVIKLIRKAFRGHSIVCAFTGKAVHVLGKKGVSAQTIHSLVYNVEVLPKGQVLFTKKDFLDSSPSLIIVDEASMISKELYRDLTSFHIPILFVGDPGQLEPIGDNPDLMQNPDFILSKIHRQAEKSPIITLANRVRQGFSIQRQQQEELVVREKNFKASEAVTIDQIICARNKTRQNMNNGIRQYKCFDPQTVVVGEKLICLRNNMGFGVFNGMIFFVTRIKEERPHAWICDVEDELGKSKFDLPIWRPPFEMDVDPKDLVVPKDVVYCDYGYVITCHKSQGSEWDHVLVYDEWMPAKVWDMKRWRYTAITRAAKKLTYLI